MGNQESTPSTSRSQKQENLGPEQDEYSRYIASMNKWAYQNIKNATLRAQYVQKALASAEAYRAKYPSAMNIAEQRELASAASDARNGFLELTRKEVSPTAKAIS